MENRLKDSPIWNKVNDLISPLGLHPIQTSIATFPKGRRMSVFLTKDDKNVTSDDLEDAYNLLYPAFKHESLGNFSLEVSSPGLERNIKDSGEFQFFIGEKVRVYVESLSQWIFGSIKEVSKDALVLSDIKASLETRDTTMSFTFNDIKKAQLKNIGGEE